MQEQCVSSQVYPEEDMMNLIVEIPLFTEIPITACQELATMMKANWYKKDAMIIREGESGNKIFLIAKGSVKVCKTNECLKETILTTVGYGEVFGEMAILDGLPRSADVMTVEDTLVFSLKREDFLSFLKTNPEATLKLIASMSLKLRNTNELVMQHRKIQEQLRYLGQHDSLTGLYNRSFLQEEMARLESGTFYPAGLIICDVDGLKFVNDTLGHDAGDDLLVTAANIIKKCFREDDLVARVGGDEFAVLLPNSTRTVVEDGNRRIQELVSAYNDSNPVVPLSISVGCAVRDNPSVTIDQIYGEADNNMYRCKHSNSKSARGAIINNLMKTAKVMANSEQQNRLRKLVALLGKTIGLTEHRLAELDLFVQFHDLGNIGIPGRNRRMQDSPPPDRVTEMQRHCEVGYRIASCLSETAPVADWILKHHEWWNGQGYPLGISGEEIPLECRILAICKAYDTFISKRLQQGSVWHEEAIAEIRKGVGTRFDPHLVEVFIRSF